MLRKTQDRFASQAERRADISVQSDFGWNKRSIEGGRGAFYYPDDAISALSESGLDEILYRPDAIGVLDSFEPREISETGYSTVYRLEDTSVEVEKHHPDVLYEKAFSDVMRRVPSAFILGHLLSNIRLQEVLADERQYTTPRLLGHLVLRPSSQFPARHYTLNEKLNSLNFNLLDHIGSTGTEGEIRKSFSQQVRRMPKDLGCFIKFAGFKPHQIDMSHVLSEDGRLQTGVTTKPIHPLRKCLDAPKTPTVTRPRQDYYAPWLRNEPQPTKLEVEEVSYE